MFFELELRVKKPFQNNVSDKAVTVKPLPSGKDEMNLCEFPIASLSKTPGTEPLIFRDTILDSKTNEKVERCMQILPAVTLGLPTSADEEVLVALIQLTASQGFQSHEIHFTPYQILSLLGWKPCGATYQRLKESLLRWKGVTLSYEKAWWGKGKQSWRTKTFSILDEVSLVGSNEKLTESTKSSVTWSRIIFQSFQEGNLKPLDFDFFRELSTPIARRMYRYLDKKFHQNPVRTFPLDTFACDHIGLSRNYNTGQLKVKLRGAIAELCEKGFIKECSESERYQVKKPDNKTFVTFVRGNNKLKTPVQIEDVPLNDVPENQDLVEYFHRWIRLNLSPHTFPGGEENWEKVKALVEAADLPSWEAP